MKGKMKIVEFTEEEIAILMFCLGLATARLMEPDLADERLTEKVWKLANKIGETPQEQG